MRIMPIPKYSNYQYLFLDIFIWKQCFLPITYFYFNPFLLTLSNFISLMATMGSCRISLLQFPRLCKRWIHTNIVLKVSGMFCKIHSTSYFYSLNATILLWAIKFWILMNDLYVVPFNLFNYLGNWSKFLALFEIWIFMRSQKIQL